MTPSTQDRKKDERRGSGFLFSFLRKAGLAPSAAPVGAPVIGIGVRGASVAGQAILGGLFATEGGRAALAVALVTLVTVAVAAAGAFFTSSVRRGSCAGDLPWVFPERPRAAAPVEPQPSGASGSLGYMAQAAKSDSWLQEKIGASEADESAQAGAAAAPQTAGVAGASGAPGTAGVPAAGDRRTTIAKLPSFAGQTSVLGGVGGLTRGPAAGLRDAVNGLKPVGMGKLAAMSRRMTSVLPRGRMLKSFRGARTSDALLAANRDGRSQLYARNPAMNQAGLTFDGAGQGVQSSAAGPIGAGAAGEEGPRNRFAPSNVVDQKEVPQPASPTASGEKNSTPYQGIMVAAIGSLLIAMLLMVLAGRKKDAAKALVGPAKAAMLSAAAMLHFLAAAAAAVAAVLGALLIKNYDQTMQGMIFVASGGLLAAFNIKAALDLRKGAAEAEKAKGEALQGIAAKDAVINEKLDSASAGGS